jgi:transcriptional regulator PpsR
MKLSSEPSLLERNVLNLAGLEGADRKNLLETIEWRIVPELVLAHLEGSLGLQVCADVRGPPTVEEVGDFARISLQGDVQDALHFTEEIVKQGVSLEVILLHLISAAARLLGDQWLEDELTFLEVTEGLSTIQQVVHALGPSFAPGTPHRGNIILITPQPEQHTLGIFLAGEFFRRAGWSVQVTPCMGMAELIDTVENEHIEALGISVTHSEHFPHIAPLVRAAREATRNPAMVIMLGGAPEVEDQAKALGVLYCRNAKDAVELLDKTCCQWTTGVLKRARSFMENTHGSERDRRPSKMVEHILAAAADLVLSIDGEGVIQEVSLGDWMAPHPGWKSLEGRPWVSAVAQDSRAKVETLLTEARSKKRSKSREVNLQVEGLTSAPFRFAALLDEPRVLAIGRDLRPIAEMQQKLVTGQQAMDIEYGRLRQADMRYRVLFQVASEGVLVVDAGSRRVLETNPAAAMMLGVSAQGLQNKDLVDFFEGPSRRIVEALVAAAEGGARAVDTLVHLRGPPSRPVMAAATAFRQTGATLVLFRFRSAEWSSAVNSQRSSRMLSVMEALPDGFVVAGEDGRILAANTAFCELTQQPSEGQLIGEPLERWLGRPDLDLSIILANLREHGMVRNFATFVRGEFGTTTEVQVTAVSALDGKFPCVGLTLRPAVSPVGASAPPTVMPHSVEQLKKLVGRVPLKELVRESAELIERLCIEAALSLSKNNRASAAQLLGLSRQGLYLKLNRHGFENGEEAKPGPAPRGKKGGASP